MEEIDLVIENLDSMKDSYENDTGSSSGEWSNDRVINFINDAIKELKNLKSQINPVTLSLSNNASTLASVLGAQIQCSFGVGPGSYIGSRFKTMAGGKPASNISDSKFGANLLPFPGCNSPTNPFFKPPFLVPPLPCLPQVVSFIPTNPTVLLENMPITTINSKGMCTFAPGGIISFSNAGQNNAKIA